MAKSNIRMFSLNHIKDLLNSSANWLDMGVTHVEPKFVNDKSITGARYGMVTMDASLKNLVENCIITPETALNYAIDKEMLSKMLLY